MRWGNCLDSGKQNPFHGNTVARFRLFQAEYPPRSRKEDKMSKQISEERKTAYSVGLVLSGIGLLIFLSSFLIIAFIIATQPDFEDMGAYGGAFAFCCVGGFILILVGGIIQRVGAAGLAGSGVVLDPDRARQELEPYTRMAGGMVKDALDEADIRLGGAPERIVMVKCPACGKLNEEDSKFCQECGKPLGPEQ